MSTESWVEALLAEGETLLGLLGAPQVDLDLLQVHLERRGVLLQEGPGPEARAVEPAEAELLRAQDANLLAVTRRRKNLEARALKRTLEGEGGTGGSPRYVDRRS